MLSVSVNSKPLNELVIFKKFIYEVHMISFQTFFFRMDTFIDSTHEILVPFEVIPSGCNVIVVLFQQLLEGPMEVLLCERVNDLRHSLFHLLNYLMTKAL